MMGGMVSVQILDEADAVRLERAAARVLDRIEAWAGRLTRFSAGLRAHAPQRGDDAAGADRAHADRRPGLGADGGGDDRRPRRCIACWTSASPRRPGWTRRSRSGPRRRWSLHRSARGAAVERAPGVRFDLDGVAKGWLADRALAITPGRSALVDGDGDVAVRVAPGDSWGIGIGDPREPGTLLGALDLGAEGDAAREWGIATSGTSVHRWAHPGGDAHHLIDPAHAAPRRDRRGPGHGGGPHGAGGGGLRQGGRDRRHRPCVRHPRPPRRPRGAPPHRARRAPRDPRHGAMAGSEVPRARFPDGAGPLGARGRGDRDRRGRDRPGSDPRSRGRRGREPPGSRLAVRAAVRLARLHRRWQAP